MSGESLRKTHSYFILSIWLKGQTRLPWAMGHTPKETGQSLTDRLSLSGPRRAPCSRCSQEWLGLERFRDAGPNEHRMGRSSRYLPWLELKEPPETRTKLYDDLQPEVGTQEIPFIRCNKLKDYLSLLRNEWREIISQNYEAKKNTCAACFTVRHSNVFIYTWAAHDPMFSVSQSSAVQTNSISVRLHHL